MPGRRPFVAVVICLVAAGMAACDSGDDGPSFRMNVDGRALVNDGADQSEVTDGSRRLRAGMRVELLTGTATVDLGDESRLELLQGTELEVKSVGSDLRPVVVAGDLLASSGEKPVVVESRESSGSTIRVSPGSARISAGLSLLVAVYRGSAETTSAGRSISVPALRQVVVPAVGLLPAAPSPISLSATHPWDLRFLGDAMELGDQLIARSRGFTGQVPANEGRTPDFYRVLLPPLAGEPSFGSPPAFTAERAPGETLVGAAISVEGRLGGFSERLTSVFRFRDEGASWGLVALDQQVARNPLLSSIDQAIGRTAASATPPPTVLPVTPTTIPRVTTVTTRPPVTVPTTLPPFNPNVTSTTAIPGPVNTGLPVDNTVNALVDALSGVLKGLGLS